MVTVYTKEHCPQCAATKRRLNNAGVEYVEENALQNLDKLKSMGFRAAPVVMTEGKSWSGYRPDLLDELTSSSTVAIDNGAAVLA